MKNLTQIQCFIKVAELKSFSKAAKALFVSPTAVSKQIKKLEEQIDHQLFIRNPRSIDLTEFAHSLYIKCKALNDQLNDINQFIDSEKQEPQGNLRVLVSSHLSKQFILQHLKDYMIRYPLLNLELTFAESNDNINRKDFDIMLGYAWVSSGEEQWKAIKMFDINNILCASPEYIKQHGQPAEAEELVNHKMISHLLRMPATTIPLADGNNIPCAAPILLMNDFNALHQACLNGIGILLTGDSMVKQWLERGELIQILPQYKYLSFEIFIFYRAYEYELSKIKTFIEFFRRFIYTKNACC